MKITKLLAVFAFVAATLSGCIDNDVPYPKVYGNFVKFEVEDQLKAASIDTVKGTVIVYLPEYADLKRVHITTCQITDREIPQLNITMDPVITAGDYLDLSSPKNYTISTFQNYEWTITAEQTIVRNFTVQNQIGASQINVEDKSVLIFVPETQRIDRITVLEAQLGPSIATISPDPLAVTDFTNTQVFAVSYLDVVEEWRVRIMQTLVVVSTEAADAWDYLHGSGQVFELESEFDSFGELPRFVSHLSPLE